MFVSSSHNFFKATIDNFHPSMQGKVDLFGGLTVSSHCKVLSRKSMWSTFFVMARLNLLALKTLELLNTLNKLSIFSRKCAV